VDFNLATTCKVLGVVDKLLMNPVNFHVDDPSLLINGHFDWLPEDLLMETHEGLNPDLLVETEDNSIGKESQRSWPDHNRPEMLRLSNRYTNSRGWHDLVEHNDPATRAPLLQAIEELARTSRTSTELLDECEVLLAETQWGWSFGKRRRTV
jgi:hypothetical protein